MRESSKLKKKKNPTIITTNTLVEKGEWNGKKLSINAYSWVEWKESETEKSG